ncbi:MAG: dihydrofolate reductase [Limnobacter sp.]
MVDELILTEIHKSFEGDASFPQWNRQQFKEVNRIANTATPERAWGFDFVKYAKVSN